MSRETIKYLADLIPEKDIETIYKVMIRFIPEETPLQDEIEAMKEANKDSTAIAHNNIKWD
nr:MAG TPA: hypothetical protein [Caudoviricetes sp.]